LSFWGIGLGTGLTSSSLEVEFLRIQLAPYVFYIGAGLGLTGALLWALLYYVNGLTSFCGTGFAFCWLVASACWRKGLWSFLGGSEILGWSGCFVSTVGYTGALTSGALIGAYVWGAGVAIGAVAGFGATIGALTGSYFFKSEGYVAAYWRNGLSSFLGAGALDSLTAANAFFGELSGESFFIQLLVSIFFGASFWTTTGAG